MKLPKKGITGIYKITNPKGRVYIGQARCIRVRWLAYRNKFTKNQPKIYRSLKKYGIENHKFEIIHECEIEDLNRLERYYQELYDVLGDNGLNLTLQDADESPRVLSEETKRKIGDAHRGKVISEEHKNRLYNLMSGSKNPKYTLIIGKNYKTKEILEMGVQEWTEYLNCDRVTLKKNIHILQLIQRDGNINDWDLNYKYNPIENKPINFGYLKIYLDIYTGIYFYGRQDLADFLNVSINQLKRMLKDQNNEMHNRIKIV